MHGAGRRGGRHNVTARSGHAPRQVQHPRQVQTLQTLKYQPLQLSSLIHPRTRCASVHWHRDAGSGHRSVRMRACGHGRRTVVSKPCSL